MYFPYFITYICVGVAITLIVLFWAVRNGQFQDQQRARFLPLEGDSTSENTAMSRWKRVEIYGLFFLAGAGLLSSAAVLVFALLKGN